MSKIIYNIYSLWYHISEVIRVRILGIDPGYGLIGFGVLDKLNNGFKIIDYGAISTPKEKTLNERLHIIYDSMNALLDKFQPEAMAIEKLYWGRNITTAIPVAEARGVILLAVQQRGIPIYEYTPLQVKSALVGTAKADKRQVQFMVKTILGLQKIPRPDDAADAVAMAICHSQTNQRLRELK